MAEGKRTQLKRAGLITIIAAFFVVTTGCGIVRRVIKFPFWLITAENEDVERLKPMPAHPPAMVRDGEPSHLLNPYTAPRFRPNDPSEFYAMVGEKTDSYEDVGPK
ncbi:MAG: hypothetical protein ACOCSQ_01340 [Planctomycetota bacterium]